MSVQPLSRPRFARAPSPARGASHSYPDPRSHPNINWVGRGEQRRFDGRPHRRSTRAKLGRTGATVRYPVHSVRSKIVAPSAKIRKPAASNRKVSVKPGICRPFSSAEGNQLDWAIVVGSVWTNVTAAGGQPLRRKNDANRWFRNAFLKRYFGSCLVFPQIDHMYAVSFE
jgi:hypothetical protein